MSKNLVTISKGTHKERYFWYSQKNINLSDFHNRWENDRIALTNQINEYKNQIKSLKEDVSQTSKSRAGLLG